MLKQEQKGKRSRAAYNSNVFMALIPSPPEDSGLYERFVIPEEVRKMYPEAYKRFINRQKHAYKTTNNGEKIALNHTLVDFLSFLGSERLRLDAEKERLKTIIRETQRQLRKRKPNKEQMDQRRRAIANKQRIEAEEAVFQISKSKTTRTRVITTIKSSLERQLTRTLRGNNSERNLDLFQAVMEPLNLFDKYKNKLDEAQLSSLGKVTFLEDSYSNRPILRDSMVRQKSLREFSDKEIETIQLAIMRSRSILLKVKNIIMTAPKDRVKITRNRQHRISIKLIEKKKANDYLTDNLIKLASELSAHSQQLSSILGTSNLNKSIDRVFYYANLSTRYNAGDTDSALILLKSRQLCQALGTASITMFDRKDNLNFCASSEETVHTMMWMTADRETRKEIMKYDILQTAPPFSKRAEYNNINNTVDKVEKKGKAYYAKQNIEALEMNSTDDEATDADDEIILKKADQDHREQIEQTTQRAFDQSKDSDDVHNFRFKFDNSVDEWDPQMMRFTAIDEIRSKYPTLFDECAKARPVQSDSCYGLFLYSMILQEKHPKELQLLREVGFFQTSTNKDDYVKQCKLFTSQIKYCYSALKNEGISPTVLFELEQLSGYKTANKDLSWKENIEEWISEKSNMMTPLAAIISRLNTGKQLDPTMLSNTMITEAILDDASIFNASGVAKGEKIDMKAWHEINPEIPRTARLNKTAVNLVMNWSDRDKMVFNNDTMMGYPLIKKEVAKARFIVNTDLQSHYQLSPIESLITKISKESDIFNMRTMQNQNKDQREWINKPRSQVFFCADQSSFDNNCSRFSFEHILAHIYTNTKDRFKNLLFIIRMKFANRAIFVTDGSRLTRWNSGMLSGWKITSQFDSLINLAQMEYTTRILKQQYHMIRVLGDDVIMQGSYFDTKAIISAMNQQGLVQHPDKTITSSRFAEFLRGLYDSQERSLEGYPSRLVPAILFGKPWTNPYMEDEWDGNSATARVKLFRQMATRLHLEVTDDLICNIAAIDIKKRQSATSNVKIASEQLKGKVLRLEVGEKYTTDKDKQHLQQILTTLPVFSPTDIVNGRLKPYDMARVVASNSSAANSTFIRKILKQEMGSTQPQTMQIAAASRAPPFPKPWIRKILKLPDRDFRVSIALHWGQRELALRRFSTQQEEDYQIRLLSLEGAHKDDLTTIIPVPEQAVALTLRVNKLIAAQEPTTEQAIEKYNLLMATTDWNQALIEQLSTLKVFT
jgi:hypothetical protein